MTLKSKKVSVELSKHPHEVMLIEEKGKWIVTGTWKFHFGQRLGTYKTEKEARMRHGLIKGETYFIPPPEFMMKKGGSGGE